MCFSAVASFVGAAVIFLCGALLCVVNVKYLQLLAYKYSHIEISEHLSQQLYKNAKHWWPALLTPMLFAMQQCSEGFVWLAIDRGNEENIAGYIFCFFAFCLWPTWVPFVCLLLESRVNVKELSSDERKSWQFWINMLCTTLLLGILISIYTFISVFSSDLTFSAKNSHVVYHFPLADIGDDTHLSLLLPYLFCTLFPFFLVKSVPYMWLMSLYIGVAAILSYILYSEGSFASTWCFFAAWLSMVIGMIRKWDAEILYKSHDVVASSRVGQEEEEDLDDGFNQL
jgi:hypothetical protein